MIRIARSRLLGRLLCATAAAFIWPAPASAIDEEPSVITEDVGDEESGGVLPPGAEDEDRPAARFREDRPERSRASEKPAAVAPTSKSAARDEATRTLLSEPKKDMPNPLLDDRGPDYYDRRAKQLLKEDENRGVVTLHPLMQDFPDSYVVVCAAGCPHSDRAKIVSMLPKRKPVPEPVSTPAAAPDVLSCVAGCGERGSLAAAPAAPPVAETVGEWMTSLAKVPAGAEAPAPKVGGSGDWMSKINEDRAGGKPVATPAPAPAPVAAVPADPAAKPDVKAAPPVAAPEVQAVTEAKHAAPVAAVAPKTVAAAEAKPAAPVVAPTPVELTPVEPKPAVVAEVKPAEPVAAKPAAPAVGADAKPAAPVASAKPAAAPAVAPAPETKVAALETPKAADPAPAAVTPRREAETPADAKSAASIAAPAEAETKVAAVAPPAIEKPAAAVPPKTKDSVISVLSEDKEMNAAIAKARGSLGAFWKSHAAPATTEADHALKVAIAGNGTTEHFWLTRIKRDNGKLSGVISNQPQSVTSVKMGQRFEFSEDMISDWTFKRNGKLVGNETMRVLLPRMPAEQASVYRNMYETP